MAAQLEDGFTRIADQILEEIPKYKLNGTQFRILMVVWRYTYGFSRKDHELSLTFFDKATGLGKTQIDRELKNLIDYDVLKVTQESTYTQSRKLGFNKNFDQWKIGNSQQKEVQSAKTLTVSENAEEQSAKMSTGTVSKNADQDIHSFKDNLKDITTTEDDLKKVADAYYEIHKHELKTRDWPDVTKAVKEFGADRIISVMEEKSVAALGAVTTFRYYLPVLRNGEERSKPRFNNVNSYNDILNNFLKEG